MKSVSKGVMDRDQSALPSGLIHSTADKPANPWETRKGQTGLRRRHTGLTNTSTTAQ